MEKQELIFENRILLILKRCSHHDFLADLAQIFKKRLRTSRRINKKSVIVKVLRFKEEELKISDTAVLLVYRDAIL